jgi:DNA-binding CsgD family transcriptional regulator
MLCRKAQEVVEAGEPKGTPELLRDKMASSLSYLVVLVVFGFVIGCLLPSAQRTSSDTLAVTIMVFLQITIPLMVLFVLLRLYRRINIAYICQLALVLILAAIAFTASQVGTDDSTVISVAVFLPRHFIRMLLIVILAVLSPQLSRRPALFFSIGYAALLFSMAVGFFISGSPWFSYPLPQTTFVSIVLVMLIVVLAAISLDMILQRDSQLFPTTVATEERLSHTDIIIDKCNGIALHHNLSKREYEVMCLICIGRSKSYIAEHLILSENTVRSYAKTLYSKLDIHSRQELLDLIE